tara:strand:- start:263 stop:1507 length:1245 start_codon:yes stop_codon:yes gene_type:complete
MSKIQVYEKDGRLVVILPGFQLFRFEQDGDLQAANGTASDEVTVSFTQNSDIFVLNYAFGNFVAIDGTTLIGSTRDATVTNLNALFDAPPKLRDDLDVNGKTITSASNGDVVIDPDGTGSIVLKSDDIQFQAAAAAFTSGTIRLFESSLLTPQHYIAIASPASVTANTTLTLPDGAGSSGQALKTNGSGLLSWGDVMSSLNPIVNGDLKVKNSSPTARGRLLLEDNGNDKFIGLAAPASVGTNLIFTLPGTDGTADQVLTTNGSGVLSFKDAAGGSDGWHGSTSQIKVMPSEFVSGPDVGRAKMAVRIKEVSSTLGAAVDVTTGKAFAFVPIPDGYKAVSVKVSLSSSVSNGAKVSHYSIVDGAITNTQIINTNTTVNLTSQLTSSNTNALAIQVTPGSLSILIHGATVAIQSV